MSNYGGSFQNLGVWQEQVSPDQIMLLEPGTINLKSKYQRRHRLILDKVEEMAAEFRRLPDGQNPKTVVLVVPSADSYEFAWDIVYGAHRVAAAIAAGKKIPAFNGKDLDEATRVRTAIAENLIRQDPNPMERVEALLQLIEVELGFSQEYVVRLLSWDHNGQKSVRDNAVPVDWERFCAFMEAVPGGMKPSTFHKRYMPLLAMPESLSEAVRSGAIDYTKALELRKLEGEELESALFRAIEFDQSLSEIKAEVAKAKPAKGEDGFKAAATRLRSARPEKMEPELREAIAAKVKELMDLLSRVE